MSRLAPLALCSVVLAASGCHSYLVPFDERPLPAQVPLETRGGQLLAVSGDGALVSRPARGDVAAALGVALHESEGGVFVTNALVPGTGLERGDQLLWASAVLPRRGRSIQEEHGRALVAAALGDTDALEAFSPTSRAQPEVGSGTLKTKAPRGSSFWIGPYELKPQRDVPTPEVLRGRADAHPIARALDLRGYLAGAGWLELDLLVRRGERELVVRLPLQRRESWVPTRPRLPAQGRWRGLELVPVTQLPRELRPREAAPDEVLVARVARGSPLGQAGLRPLDLISADDAAVLLGAASGAPSLSEQLSEEGEVRIAARAPDGRQKDLRFRPRGEPTHLWFPFAFVYEADSSRYHFGLGWWDVLFHASGRLEYLPSLDDYVETKRWSLLTVVSGGQESSEEGTVRKVGVNLLLDPVRLDYFSEWFGTPGEVRGERGLEGY